MKHLALGLILVLVMSGVSLGAVVGEPVDYAVDGLIMKGYLAYDSALEGKRPGILVVHEWWGHNEYARTRARMLAELGYTALAVDMFGDGKQAMHPDDAGKFATEAMTNLEDGKKRFEAALSILKSHPTTDGQHIGAIGYCFGGGVVLNMARLGVDLDGVASFHGSLAARTVAAPGTIKARILVLTGGDDKMVPPEQVAAFEQEMKTAGADYRVVIYPGALHSFTNPEADEYSKKFGIPVGYNEAADKASWNEMKAFFAGVFGQ